MGLLKENNPPYDTFLFRSAARPHSLAHGQIDIHSVHLPALDSQRTKGLSQRLMQFYSATDHHRGGLP